MKSVKITIVLLLCWFATVQCEGEEEGLSEHNRLRALHGVSPLTLNDYLSQQCAEYAVELTSKQSLDHSKSDGRYGENLCLRSSHPGQCVQDWYDEISEYDFSNPRFTFPTGHFTQLVWAGSTEMGWGQATDKKGVTYVVARYTPTGNIAGEFANNVPEPLAGNGGQIEVSLIAMTISICFVLLKFKYCRSF